jgi:hypothetical protein
VQIRILVLDRGRVNVGYLERHPTLAFHWILRNARIIRRWGTSEGLEQIAADGPTSNTLLDRPCNKEIPWRAVLEILECREEAWTDHLNTDSGNKQNVKTTRG